MKIRKIADNDQVKIFLGAIVLWVGLYRAYLWYKGSCVLYNSKVLEPSLGGRNCLYLSNK